MARRSAPVVSPPAFALLAFLLIPFAVVNHAAAGNLTGTVMIGFDSFRESYSIVESDTLDELTELRTRISLGYVSGDPLRGFFRIEGSGRIGQESMESSARLQFQQALGNYRFQLGGQATQRSYHDETTLSFPNDFMRYDVRAQVRNRVGSNLRLRAWNRLEILNFDRRTEFDYDYVRNVFNVGAEVSGGLTTTLSGNVGYAVKIIPDSTQISYDAVLAGVEYRWFMGLQRQISFTLNTERRIFGAPAIKSPYWTALSTARIQPVAFGHFGLGIENTFESYFYDNDSGAFFDYIENWTAVLLGIYPFNGLSIRVGPTVGFYASGASPEDEYVEGGGKLLLELVTKRLFVSGSYEPGFRNYELNSADTVELVFSDYLFHRVLVFASARVWRGLNLNGLLSFEPEDHEVANDDATATLISLDLTYSF